MISTSNLAAGLVENWVAFDKNGNLLDIEIPGDIGPAALMVTPVTDAVKRVEEDIVESMDRNRMWSVEAIVLNRIVVERFEPTELSAEELLAMVREMGFSWQISPISAP